MTNQNSEAPSQPVKEEASEASTRVPQSFGQALLHGLKLGFKWGNRIGIAFCGLMLLLALSHVARRGELPFIFGTKGFPPSTSQMIRMLVASYIWCCLTGILTGMLGTSAVYVVHKGARLLRRG